MQIESFKKGLLVAVLDRDSEGSIVRKAGVMAIVRSGGRVEPGYIIQTTLPPQPHFKLERI